MRFESKVDGWLVAVAVLIPLAVLVFIALQWYGSRHDLHGPVAGAFIVVAGVVFAVTWMFRSTYYTIEGDTLVIRAAFLTWRVPIRDIRTVTPTHNPLSSPALSLDRLQIDYGNGRFILVSPKDKAAFVDALRAINPAIMRRT